MDPAFALPARWPLVPVDVAAFYLNRLPEEVVRDCDSLWAWDISTRGARRRQIRLWRDSLMAMKAPALRRNIPVRLDQVIDALLPPRSLRGRDLQMLLYCTPQHVAALCEDGLIRVERDARARSGPHASRIYSRAGIRGFLVRRVLGQPALQKIPTVPPLHPNAGN